MYLLYNLLLLVLSPILAAFFVWRIVGSGKSRRSWRQQIGLLPESVRRKSDRPRIWIHAVSVGETVASAPIFRELRALLPDAEMIVSTTTTTGHEMAKKAIPEAEHVIYFPLDIPAFVRRSLNRVKPDLFVSVESEIWPNFLVAARRMNVPAMVVNGIVSDRTAAWGRRLRPIYRMALRNVERFLMQTQDDADRVIELGAPPDRVSVVGNCKFDQEMGGLSADAVDDLRRGYGFTNGSRVFIAGSTNPGEDEPVIEAFQVARETVQDLRMVIAPRQIERSEAICAMIAEYGLTCGRRSESERLTGSEDVVVLDTFGELAAVYAIGEVSFVGGSLIPKGGHNILQPIAHGKPVFYGPYMFKSRDLVSQAKAAGVGFEVRDGEELGRKMAEMLSHPETLDDVRKRALTMIEANKGASRRCARAIAEVLSRADGSPC